MSASQNFIKAAEKLATIVLNGPYGTFKIVDFKISKSEIYTNVTFSVEGTSPFLSGEQKSIKAHMDFEYSLGSVCVTYNSGSSSGFARYNIKSYEEDDFYSFFISKVQQRLI